MIAGGDIALNLRCLANSESLMKGFTSGALVQDRYALQTLTTLEVGLETEARDENLALLVLLSAYKKALLLEKREELQALGPAIAQLIQEQSVKLDQLLFQINRSSREIVGVKRFAPSGMVVAAIQAELKGGFVSLPSPRTTINTASSEKVNGNGNEERGPVEASDLEKTRATPESFLNILEGEFKRIQNKLTSLQESLPPEVSEKYSEELVIIEQRITYWMEAILALEELEKKERRRLEEDILIGERILLSRLLQLGVNIFSEPVDEGRLSSIGLRTGLGIVPKRRPREPEIDIITPAKGKIVPALVNHDIGFGRNLALRPAQIIPINRLRGLFRLRKEALALNGATEELLRGTVVMSVGGGKTRVMVTSFALAIEEGLFGIDRGDKFIILNHTEQIHGQNKEVVELLGTYFHRRFGRKLKVTEYKAETKDTSGDVVVVSIPSINTEERRGEFEKSLRGKLGEEGKIVMTAIDEIHHLELGKGRSKESWQEAVKVLRQITPDFYRIGFTATPTGKEGPYIARIRELDLMRAGVTPRTYLVRVEGEDLSQLKVSEQARDFQTRALVSTLLKYPDRNRRLYEALERHGIKREDRSPSGRERFEGVLGFAADVRHAQRMAGDYQDYFAGKRKIEIVGDEKGKVNARDLAQALARYEKGEVDALAVVVSDETAPTMRQRILRLVAEGKIEAAFNVGIWTEGADLWMFTHLLGGRPTFSRYQRGQERGRLNRRGPEDVSSQGALLSDKPKILFDVIDRYHGDRALVRYGDLMGVRGHTAVAYGELFDAMEEEIVTAIDMEGRAIAHKDLEEMVQRRREISRPDLQVLQAPLTAKLWEIFENQYAKDIEAMAQDLGIPVEEIEQILQGKGWINARWFLRRLATLLYQDRQLLLNIYNDERGLKDERVTDADLQIVRGTLALYQEWDRNKNTIGIKQWTLDALVRGILTDLQWRNLWSSLAVYFSGVQEPDRQEQAKETLDNLMNHLFKRERWSDEVKTAQERLLYEARKLVALKWGGRLPHDPQIEGAPKQIDRSPLTRWIKMGVIEFKKNWSAWEFYPQVRALLVGLGKNEKEADKLIVEAIFERESWNRKEDTAQERLLYEARKLVALKWGGKLPYNPKIEGVFGQDNEAILTHWIQGKTIRFGGGGATAENFYSQVRSLLIGLGKNEKEADRLIIEAVFDQEGWERKENTAQERLLYEARKLIALKFGGRLPQTGRPIAGVSEQHNQAVLTRWIKGETIRFSRRFTTTSLYSQGRGLLVGLGKNEKETDRLIVEAVFEQEDWNKKEATAEEKLLYEARKVVALRFGGRVSYRHPVIGVSQQERRASLTRFLAGEPVQLTPSLLSQIRALLLHEGANQPEEVERWLEAAAKE